MYRLLHIRSRRVHRLRPKTQTHSPQPFPRPLLAGRPGRTIYTGPTRGPVTVTVNLTEGHRVEAPLPCLISRQELQGVASVAAVASDPECATESVHAVSAASRDAACERRRPAISAGNPANYDDIPAVAP